MKRTPVYIEDSIKFIIKHKPTVQKNDLIIKRRRSKAGKLVPYIGHSARLENARNFATLEMFKQYKEQGHTKPINEFIIVDCRFYVLKNHEPDSDNLPSMYLDAMQGIKVKGGGIIGKILEDDKLVRLTLSEKIVEGDEQYYGKPRAEIEIVPWPH